MTPAPRRIFTTPAEHCDEIAPPIRGRGAYLVNGHGQILGAATANEADAVGVQNRGALFWRGFAVPGSAGPRKLQLGPHRVECWARIRLELAADRGLAEFWQPLPGRAGRDPHADPGQRGAVCGGAQDEIGRASCRERVLLGV